MTKVLWSFDSGEVFEGFSDGSTWNGWDNIYLKEESFLMVLDFLANDVYGGDWCEMLEEVFYNDIEIGENGLYSLAYGFTCQIIKEVN